MKNDIDFQMHSLCILTIINELCSITDDSPNHWGRDRIDWEKHVELKIFERRFHVLYRMDYSSFLHLHDILCPFLNRMESKSRSMEAISNVTVVACGVRYLAGEKLRSLESDLGISKSSAYVAKDKFIDAVLQCPDLDIQFPTTTDELSSIARGFEAKATASIFQGCVGAIDGFFQPTKQPSVKESFGNQRAYFSGHYRMYGLNVQAVVDANLKFIYFGVIGPGSMNDNRSYKKSGLESIINNLPNGFFILGDAAYTLSNNLLIPFVGSNRHDPAKDAYNFYLSQLRIRVEMSFGRLVKKWGILREPLCCSLKRNSDILVACGRLHNFVLVYNDSEPDQPCYSSPSMPSGFEYLPTRVEDREDVDDFIESSVLGASRNRDIIVDFIRHEKFTRPTYNLARNAGNIDGNDSNVLFYTVI